MIKDVKELPSNIENIATLLVSSIDEDKINLKKKVEGALKTLLKVTLIQKNGNEYIFLTNDEQDVNREIQNEEVEFDEVLKKVCEVLFLEIYNQRKFNYGKYNFRRGFHSLLKLCIHIF